MHDHAATTMSSILVLACDQYNRHDDMRRAIEFVLAARVAANSVFGSLPGE
jgi:hypothetical protein